MSRPQVLGSSLTPASGPSQPKRAIELQTAAPPQLVSACSQPLETVSLTKPAAPIGIETPLPVVSASFHQPNEAPEISVARPLEQGLSPPQPLASKTAQTMTAIQKAPEAPQSLDTKVIPPKPDVLAGPIRERIEQIRIERALTKASAPSSAPRMKIAPLKIKGPE